MRRYTFAVQEPQFAICWQLAYRELRPCYSETLLLTLLEYSNVVILIPISFLVIYLSVLTELGLDRLRARLARVETTLVAV